MERLVRMGLLDISRKKWRQVGGPILVENEISTSATKKFQEQVLEKGTMSLREDPMEIREMSSMTIAMDPKQMLLAIQEIKKFRIYLMELLEKTKSPQEVYHLAVQLYPVSKRRV